MRLGKRLTTAVVLIVLAGSLTTVVTATAAAPKPAPGAAPVPVKAGQTVTGIDGSLHRIGPKNVTVTGKLSYPSGKPITKAEIVVFDRAGQEVGTQDLYSSAGFSFQLHPQPGGYAFCFRSDTVVATCLGKVLWPDERSLPSGAKFVQLAAGHNKSLGTVRLRNGARIVGLVRDRAGRASSTAVYARSLSHPQFFAVASSARHGHYKLTGLLPSPKGYDVCFRRRKGATHSGPGAKRAGYAGQCHGGVPWNGSTPSLTGRPVHVRPGQTKRGVDATLRTAGGLEGTIVAKDTGAKLDDVRVVVLSAKKHSRHVIAETSDDASFHFKLAELVPGRSYRVCAVPVHWVPRHPRNYYGRCYRGSTWAWGQPASGATVHLRRGHLTKVRFGLSPAAAVAGTVHLPNGKPDAAARVSVYSAGGKLIGSSRTQRNGTYQVRWLKPGARGSFVCVKDSGGQRANQPPRPAPACYGGASWDGPGTPIPAGAKRVRLRNGHVTPGIDVTLPSGGAISGSITDPKSGDPLTADVEVFTADGTPLRRQIGVGKYTFTGLAPSSAGYRVCFAQQRWRYLNGAYVYGGQCWQDVDWQH